MLAEQVVQPGAECLKIVAQPVKFDVEVFQFVGRLLTGRSRVRVAPSA